jgi:hypothetical protein
MLAAASPQSSSSPKDVESYSLRNPCNMMATYNRHMRKNGRVLQVHEIEEPSITQGEGGQRITGTREGRAASHRGGDLHQVLEERP